MTGSNRYKHPDGTYVHLRPRLFGDAHSRAAGSARLARDRDRERGRAGVRRRGAGQGRAGDRQPRAVIGPARRIRRPGAGALRRRARPGMARLPVVDRGLWRHRRRVGRRNRADRHRPPFGAGRGRRGMAGARRAGVPPARHLRSRPQRARPRARRARAANRLVGAGVQPCARGRHRHRGRRGDRGAGGCLQPCRRPAGEPECGDRGGLPPARRDAAALQSLDEAGLSPQARAFYDESRRVANGKAKRVLGWRPQYPDYGSGLRACLAPVPLGAGCGP